MGVAIIGWKGERVRLTPLDRSLHLENALRWLNDPDVTAALEFHFGFTRRQEEAFFDRAELPGEHEFNWAVLNESEEHIGFIGLRDIHWTNRCALGGLMIGDRSAWGRGYATDAAQVRIRFAFLKLGLHRIDGHTINPAMRRVYEKCGYRHEGTARSRIYRDGTWHDMEHYGILRRDWDALPSADSGVNESA